LRNGLFGYDKNQVRVYFTALQAGNQRQIDQWEEKRSLLQREIDLQTTRLEQLQAQIKARQSQAEQYEQVWPRLEMMRIKLLRDPRVESGHIIEEAMETCRVLKLEGYYLAKQAKHLHQQFTSLVDYSLNNIAH